MSLVRWLMAFFVFLMENHYMPDFLTRIGMRLMCYKWATNLDCGGDVEKKQMYKNKFVDKLRTSPIAVETEKANEQHYEVPTEFYLKVLGNRLKYSSCYYPKGVTRLEDAEDEMFRMVCERVEMKDGLSALDLGCGWGSQTFWLLEHYPNSKITSLSNSNTQREFIQAEAKQRGYADRLTVITCDVNFFKTDQKFDRIISNEMFEHMKNYEILFRNVSTWLKDDGLLFVHILCHRDYAYSMTSKQDDWMGRNFFSGGTMPSADLFLYFQNDFALRHHWRINGTHYSKTLEAWLEKLDAKQAECLAIMAKTYGAQEAKKKLFEWRNFFMFCSECFAYNRGNDWIVAHYVFHKKTQSRL